MINKINPFSNNNSYIPATKHLAKASPKISFCARPEYDYLDKNYEVRASNFFRRGQAYLSQSEKFADVEKTIKLVFKQEKKPKILIVGIGKAQEPFSFLAVINSFLKGKNLNKALDMHCVDLQPKISDKDLMGYSYFDAGLKPDFAIDSFDYEIINEPNYIYSSRYKYKVKPNIFEYLKKVFNNPIKTKWDTKIQDFSKTAPAKTYDLISINNTLGYISNKEEVIQTMENLSNMLKKNGILITEVYDDWYKELFPCLKDFKNLMPGIWQKLI